MVQAICDLQLITVLIETSAPNPVKVMIVSQRKMIQALLQKFGQKCTSFRVKKENKIKRNFNHNIFINGNCNVAKHGIKNFSPLSGGSEGSLTHQNQGKRNFPTFKVQQSILHALMIIQRNFRQIPN